MGALTNVQMPVPAARFGPHAPLRAPGTKNQRPDGLAAHRGLLDGLITHFPITRRVAGDESFDAMARRFFITERSCPARRCPNWEAFPSFLRGQGKAASIEYVADIAELEMARGKAKYAADARPIGAQAFPSLAAERLNVLRLVLHPSIFLVASRFPIVTIWEINQSERESGWVGRWSAECALVARPFLEVEVRRLPPGGHAFISALSQGHTIAAALDAATATDPTFDIAINRALLIEANVVISIREQARTEQLNA
jgi:hypothetical protein